MNSLMLPRLVRLKRETFRALSFLLLVLLAGAAHAQGHSYLIERLEVRGLAHVSPEIVTDESRLAAGHTYSEIELRRGIDRVRRLPFILDADLSLEKGSERGAYILVITVDEARPVFYAAEMIPALESGRDLIRDPADNRLAAGARMFIGAHSMVHIGALTRDDDRPDSDSHQIGQIGFTRFGLLGGRAFATLTLNRSFPGDGEVVPGLVAGMYLGNDRTLTLTLEEIDSDYIRERRERVVQLRFARNTTDDPYFPDRGSVMAIVPLWLDRDVTRFLGEGRTLVQTRAWGVESELARYWALDDRWTVAAEAEGGYLNADIEIGEAEGNREDLFYGSLRTRLSWEIHSGASSDSRAELSLSTVSDRDETYGLRSGYQQVSLSWARRDAWGTVRVGVGYAW